MPVKMTLRMDDGSVYALKECMVYEGVTLYAADAGDRPASKRSPAGLEPPVPTSVFPGGDYVQKI